MITIDINVDERSVARKLLNLSSKTNVVITRGANKAMNSAATEISRETVARNALRKKDVMKILKKKKASYSWPTASLTYTDGFINLSGWTEGHGRSVVKPYYPHVGYDDEPENYFAHVKRGVGNKPLQGDGPIPFLQIAKGSRNLSLFTRTGQSRYPIRGVAAPAIPQVIKDDDIKAKVLKKTMDVFEKEVTRQIELMFKQATSR